MGAVPLEPLERLVGLASAKRVLAAIVARSAGVHGVLFYGPEGSGKSTLAHHLARHWMCNEPTDDGACGACRSCVSFANGRHADFQRIFPVQPSNWIRLGAITSNTDRVEEGTVPVIDFFRTGPLFGRTKVVLLEDADRLSSDAANALLKTLEEPPKHAKLILTTESLSRVLPTIISRCVCVVCELPEAASAAALLADLSPEEQLLVRSSPGVAAHLRAHRDLYANLLSFAQGLASRPRSQALAASEEFGVIAHAFAERLNLPARQANAETLQLLADFLAQHGVLRGEDRQGVIEAHRRIIGNGAPGIVYDALFTRILA